MKKIRLACVLVFFLVPFTSCLAYDLADYQYEETRELIRFVVEAVEEIESVGEDAFPEFRKEESKWFQDDSYIFVWTPTSLSGDWMVCVMSIHQMLAEKEKICSL